MRWALKGDKTDPKTQWHSWFAWCPVITRSNQCKDSPRCWVWLEVVSRRRYKGYEDCFWEYIS